MTSKVTSRLLDRRSEHVGVVKRPRKYYSQLMKPSLNAIPVSAETRVVSRRAAFPSCTEREELALMLIYTEGTSWSSRSGRGYRFWEEAGAYIQRDVKSSYCRTGLIPTCMCGMHILCVYCCYSGQACVFSWLSHQFPSPVAAEIFYHKHVYDRLRSPLDRPHSAQKCQSKSLSIASSQLHTQGLQPLESVLTFPQLSILARFL